MPPSSTKSWPACVKRVSPSCSFMATISIPAGVESGRSTFSSVKACRASSLINRHGSKRIGPPARPNSPDATRDALSALPSVTPRKERSTAAVSRAPTSLRPSDGAKRADFTAGGRPSVITKRPPNLTLFLQLVREHSLSDGRQDLVEILLRDDDDGNEDLLGRSLAVEMIEHRLR